MTSIRDAQIPALRIACIGGGPGGLFTAIALSRTLPGCHVDVFERNSESDVFGFGVVFSDTTLDNVDAVDPVLRKTLAAHGRRWDTIAVHSNRRQARQTSSASTTSRSCSDIRWSRRTAAVAMNTPHNEGTR